MKGSPHHEIDHIHDQRRSARRHRRLRHPRLLPRLGLTSDPPTTIRSPSVPSDDCEEQKVARPPAATGCLVRVGGPPPRNKPGYASHRSRGRRPTHYGGGMTEQPTTPTEPAEPEPDTGNGDDGDDTNGDDE